ncbi:MAG: TetR/AcrR family transcriptional regulator [Bacteroidales bacterium]|nr:TetR/AcrR family transcriptional regulator [Bacteroidales bacterium]MBN2758230.1 TetR/AcrR family transcriptional regulator [Bacteroidales bacterium]
MSPRTKEQNIDIRKNKRKLIMNSAIEVFAEKTFRGASVSLITKKAGISKGLLYSYFESKEDLLKQIIFEGIDEFIEVFNPNKDGVLTEEEFTYFVDKTFSLLGQDTHFWKLYFSLIVQPAVMELVQDKLIELVDPFIQILVEYYSKKGIENPMAYARLLGSILDGVSLNYIVDPEHFPLNEVKKIIIEKFK